MNGTSKRTDPHRVGAINPEDYEYHMSFSGASTVDGWPVPPMYVDVVIEMKKAGELANIHSSIFQCDVCGARYIHGDVWYHRPSGKYITIGHECAAKYNLYADYSHYDSVRKATITKAVRRARRIQAWRSMRNALVNYPDLKDALKVDNEITQDIRSRFIQFGTISIKQIELLMTIKKRLDERAQEDAESTWILAPEGRIQITGKVLSARVEENQYGLCYKMLVKVDTEAGSWKTWGTVPKSITDKAFFSVKDLKGCTVTFTGTVKRADDQGFSFFSRPVKGEVL